MKIYLENKHLNDVTTISRCNQCGAMLPQDYISCPFCNASSDNIITIPTISNLSGMVHHGNSIDKLIISLRIIQIFRGNDLMDDKINMYLVFSGVDHPKTDFRKTVLILTNTIAIVLSDMGTFYYHAPNDELDEIFNKILHSDITSFYYHLYGNSINHIDEKELSLAYESSCNILNSNYIVYTQRISHNGDSKGVLLSQLHQECVADTNFLTYENYNQYYKLEFAKYNLTNKFIMAFIGCQIIHKGKKAFIDYFFFEDHFRYGVGKMYRSELSRELSYDLLKEGTEARNKLEYYVLNYMEAFYVRSDSQKLKLMQRDKVLKSLIDYIEAKK